MSETGAPWQGTDTDISLVKHPANLMSWRWFAAPVGSQGGAALAAGGSGRGWESPVARESQSVFRNKVVICSCAVKLENIAIYEAHL